MPQTSLPAPPDRDSHGLVEDFRRLIATARQSWPIITVATLTCLTAASIYLARKTILYQATSRLLVLQQGGSPLHLAGSGIGQNTDSSNDYLPTQALIIRSPLVVSRALESLTKINRTTHEVIDRLAVTRPDQAAKVLQVGYTDGNAESAKEVIRAVIESYESFLEDHYHEKNRDVANLLKKARDELSQELDSLEKKYVDLVRESPASALDESGRMSQERRVEQWDRAAGDAQLKAIQLRAQLELGRGLAESGVSLQATIQAMDHLGGGVSALAPPTDGGDLRKPVRQRLVEELNDLELRRIAAERLIDDLASGDSTKGKIAKKADPEELNRLLNADPEIDDLRQRLKAAEERVAAAQRVARSQGDPALRYAIGLAASLRGEFDELRQKRRPAIEAELARNEYSESESQKAKAELAGVRAREQTVKDKLAEIDSDTVRLLEGREKEIIGRFGPKDSQVATIRAQIDRIKRGETDLHEQGAVHELLGAIGRGLTAVESMREEIQRRFTEDLNVSRRSEVDRLAMDNLRSNLDRQRTLFNTVVDQLKQVQLAGDFNGITAQVLEQPSTSAVRPNIPLVLAVALAAGLALGLGLAVVTEQLDQRLRTVEEIRKAIKLPVMGLVAQLPGGRIETPGGVGMLCHVMPRSALAEGFRVIRANIDLQRRSRSLQVILVTSPLPCDGKSTTASNLAISLSQAGRRVLLVDADLRRPTLDSIHGISRDRGLTQILGDRMPIHEAIQPATIPNLDLITAGSEAPNPAELLTSARLGEFLNVVRQNYDSVIIDSPPILTVADATILGGAVDGILLVVRASALRLQDALRATELLQTIGTSPLGVVINGIDPRQFGNGSGYGYGYGYGAYGSTPAARISGASRQDRKDVPLLSAPDPLANGHASLPRDDRNA